MLLGIGACAAALFLVAYAIPFWVAAPSNVPNLILSPLFWPYTLAGCTALAGLGLIGSSLRLPAGVVDAVEDAEEFDTSFAWGRLGALAAVMLATFYLIPLIGMVWASILCFASTSFLAGMRQFQITAACAVVLPFVLYAFFAHVAGVAIPQGVFVRLP